MNGLPQRQQAVCSGYRLSWREAGQGQPVVLLHGISSSSASWVKQFNDPLLLANCRLIAWDAPGYGGSYPLTTSQPDAKAYANALVALLVALDVRQPLLVGHSLGALIGSAFAAGYPEALRGLVLADPAQGYAREPETKRQQVYGQRQQMMATLGPQGYGEQRASALLRQGADEKDIAWVRSSMQRLDPEGFLSAAWMLANDDIDAYLVNYRGPLEVWCGDEDSITPPATAAALAQRLGTTMQLIPQAGHASYLDAPAAFNRYVQNFTGVMQP
jgi:pimeloyl-ACP methyl ester carboxylesterase